MKRYQWAFILSSLCFLGYLWLHDEHLLYWAVMFNLIGWFIYCAGKAIKQDEQETEDIEG